MSYTVQLVTLLFFFFNNLKFQCHANIKTNLNRNQIFWLRNTIPKSMLKRKMIWLSSSPYGCLFQKASANHVLYMHEVRPPGWPECARLLRGRCWSSTLTVSGRATSRTGSEGRSASAFSPRRWWRCWAGDQVTSARIEPTLTLWYMEIKPTLTLWCMEIKPTITLRFMDKCVPTAKDSRTGRKLKK